jgi:hypothetical protein
MKKILVFILVIGVLGCSENQEKKILTLDDFNTTLTATMDYNDLVSAFGEPSKDIGSGIHIYVYELGDSSEIWIGYTDKIHYASHVSKSGQLLDVLI